MRSKIFLTIGALALTTAAILAAIQLLSSRRNASSSVHAATPLTLRSNSADSQIQVAEARIAQLPSDPDGYNQLAAAFMQKARETGDFGFNVRAEAALDQSMKLAPDNRSSQTLHATLLLTYHKFREALEEAKRMQAAGPETPELYGIMTDALVELGDYSAAIKAAQKMMNMRPDAAAYARVSYLRALHGDLEGAIEAMRVAVKASNPNNPENASWYRVHLGVELMNAGKREEAEREFDIALKVFPGYHLALAAKGRARAAAGDFDTAVDFFRQSQERVPLPDYAIALGDLYTKLGRSNEAKQQQQLLEFIERDNAGNPSLYSRQLALFWADHDTKLDEALAIMQREHAAREDVLTYDALAWCLFKKGQLSEAAEAIKQAERLGTRDARIFYHAGMIYDALGDHLRAAENLQLALATDRAFNVVQAEAAQQKLAEMGKGIS
jgi:tetratricopeptide (TPR) repeat protein